MEGLAPIANEVLEALEYYNETNDHTERSANLKLATKVHNCLDVKIMLKRDQIVDIGYGLADEIAPGNSVMHVSVRSMFQEFSRRLADKLV